MSYVDILDIFIEAQRLHWLGQLSPWNYLGQATGVRRRRNRPSKVRVKKPKPAKPKSKPLTSEEREFYRRMLDTRRS